MTDQDESTRLAKKLLDSEERKKRLQSYLQSMPDHVPTDIIEEARRFLDEGGREYESELRRILSHTDMIGFWYKLRIKFDRKYSHQLNYLNTNRLWSGLLFRCFRLMVHKGGKLPDMTPAQFNKERGKVSNDIHRLITKLNNKESAYRHIAKLSIHDMVKLCAKSNDDSIKERGHDVLNIMKKASKSALTLFWTIQTGPNFLQILTALKEQIDANEELSLNDEWIPSDNVPRQKLGSDSAQRRYFCTNFLNKLYEHTNESNWTLTATACNVVFDLSLDKKIDGKMLENSFKE